ncbi:hypothetical protein CC86DRAFT_30155 [Ophiobolus disseminans]|uniref:DUF7053 domain-containing protein n=1 Tax=Ophiobolus disseminans TaxID=1469910 RepID=A0A6A7A011_9PLEO|nr:hypothetical protein CC86DRAFT_30155 [Ophiobolus disseminans]
MPKTATFTTVTPLPAGITRKSVLDMFQDHLAMIDLNPLVVERFRCRPPSYATTDEYYQTWYTIKDKVSYLPGGLATGSVSYHACFHDTAEGLETHVYAPLGLDIRGKWSVGGSMPGEPRQLGESGINTPRHGLYIREDVNMTCSSLLMSFVKRTFKDSHASLVEKLVERAHILESNFANERLQALRNVDPGERMAIGDIFIAPPPDYQPSSDASPSNQESRQLSSLPHHQNPSAPTQSPLYRTQTQPSELYSPPTHTTHSRSISDSIASPGFSSASTAVSESDRLSTPPKDITSPTPFKFAYVEQNTPISSSAPASSTYLLPATTYNHRTPATAQNLGAPAQVDRLISLYPGGAHHSHQRNQSDYSVYPPRVSYTPEERPISFAFPNESPFDTHSNSESARSSNQNLLDEIDDAIDQVFSYGAPKEKRGNEFQKEQELVLLPSTKYDPRQHVRKDSVVPYSGLSKELPPLPLDQD